MVYVKTNYIILLNKSVCITQSILKKNLFFLKVDMYKHICWTYVKKKKIDSFLITLAIKFHWKVTS